MCMEYVRLDSVGDTGLGKRKEFRDQCVRVSRDGLGAFECLQASLFIQRTCARFRRARKHGHTAHRERTDCILFKNVGENGCHSLSKRLQLFSLSLMESQVTCRV
jgi:hypothetical protein